jgi:hypothetical protein
MIIALLLTGVFIAVFRTRHPWPGLLWFFSSFFWHLLKEK